MNWNHWTHSNAGDYSGGGNGMHFNDRIGCGGGMAPQMCGACGPPSRTGDAELAAFRNNFMHFRPQPQPQPMVGAGCWYDTGLRNLLRDDEMYFGSSDRQRCCGGGSGSGGVGEDSGRGEFQGCLSAGAGGGGGGCKAEWLPTDNGARDGRWPSNGWTQGPGFGSGGGAGFNFNGASGHFDGGFSMAPQQQMLPDI